MERKAQRYGILPPGTPPSPTVMWKRKEEGHGGSPRTTPTIPQSNPLSSSSFASEKSKTLVSSFPITEEPRRESLLSLLSSPTSPRGSSSRPRCSGDLPPDTKQISCYEPLLEGCKGRAEMAKAGWKG